MLKLFPGSGLAKSRFDFDLHFEMRRDDSEGFVFRACTISSVKKAAIASIKGIKHAMKPKPRCSMVKICGSMSSNFVFIGGACCCPSKVFKKPVAMKWPIFSLKVSKNGLLFLNAQPPGTTSTISLNANNGEVPLRYLLLKTVLKKPSVVCETALFSGSTAISNAVS